MFKTNKIKILIIILIKSKIILINISSINKVDKIIKEKLLIKLLEQIMIKDFPYQLFMNLLMKLFKNIIIKKLLKKIMNCKKN